MPNVALHKYHWPSRTSLWRTGSVSFLFSEALTWKSAARNQIRFATFHIFLAHLSIIKGDCRYRRPNLNRLLLVTFPYHSRWRLSAHPTLVWTWYVGYSSLHCFHASAIASLNTLWPRVQQPIHILFRIHWNTNDMSESFSSPGIHILPLRVSR